MKIHRILKVKGFVFAAVFTAGFGLLFMSSCNTGKQSIKAAYAFSSPKQYGTIPVDSSGNELPLLPDTFFTVYLVTTKKSLRFDSAWYNGKRFAVSASLVPGNKAEVGLEKGSLTKPLFVTADNSHFLYSLQLTVYGQAVSPEKIKNEEMLVRFFKGESVFYRLIGKIELVEQLPAQ